MKKLLLFILFPFLTYGQVQIGQDINGEAPFDISGTSVSISSDGTIVAIGAERNDSNGSNSGHVRIYENQEDVWLQIGNDIDGEGEGDFSGRGISLSSDGTIVAIGAIGNDGNGFNSGHVRVFENQGDIWVQIGDDIDSEAQGDNSGFSVSLSSDGTILAIGAIGNDGNNQPGSGHVRIYQNQNGIWTQIGQDIDGEAIEDFSGRISLSANGAIVAIGAPENDGNGDNSGHVRVYENQNGIWTQIGQDIDGESAFDFSGASVSLSSDGTIVAIGATGNNGNGLDSGHVRVYENQNNIWTQVGEDIDAEAIFDASGFSVSLSDNGTILAIGAIGNNGNGFFSGHVRIYQNQGNSWIQIGQDIDGEAEDDDSGVSVSLSSDGTIVAIGASGNDGNGDSSGHVRVFDLSGLLATEEFTPSSFYLYPNPATTQITIEVPQGSTLEKATIYNNLGQVIISSKSTIIDTSTLSKGIYIVEVLTNQGASSKKLITN